ncbi:unnamed protein product [Arctogadus glacialis]
MFQGTPVPVPTHTGPIGGWETVWWPITGPIGGWRDPLVAYHRADRRLGDRLVAYHRTDRRLERPSGGLSQGR